eukprot:GFUD01015865.1.p1 GENE.GFUD01015865.1~~GFUD01015865.1.p1  ORF type:complete len:150 (+),score=28.49 GFUD01015865.1:125-574(+)
MPVRFVHAANGQLPPNAWPGGNDNGPQYVARSYHEGSLVPGKFVPHHGVAYIPWGGKEHAMTHYEVLIQEGPDNLVWVPASGGNLGSTGALRSGRTVSGGPLYVGRAQINGTWTLGKVNPEHKKCYIPYGGKEHALSTYQVLCVRELEL